MLGFIAFIILMVVIYDWTLARRTFMDVTFPDFLPNSMRIPLTVVAVLFLFSNGLFFKSDSATNYTLQYPFLWEAETIPGDGKYKLRFFASIVETDKEIALTQLGPKHWDEAQENPEQWVEAKEVYLLKQNRLELNDRIGIYPDFSTVLQLNSGSQLFTDMVLKTKSEANLVYSRLLPYVQKCQQYAVKLLSSEQYIAGGNAAFDQYVLDQYLNGPYELEEIVKTHANKVDTLGGNVVTTIGSGDESVSVEYQRIANSSSPGGWKRTGEEGFATYGITIIQAGIKSTQYENGFETRLENLKSIAANKQAAKENSEMYRLQQDEEGQLAELNKIKERGVKEKEQVAAVIAAKTKADKAKYYQQEQQYLLDGAMLATQVANEKEKQMKALNRGDVDPLVRLNAELKNRVDVANAIFGGKALGALQTNISGGDGKDGTSQLLNWVMTKQLSNQ